MATTSTNLSLRKPESTDFVSVSLDIAGNMQTIDDKWATSAAADIGPAAAAGSALTVARTDHVHKVGSGTAANPGLPIGEATTGFYRIGSGSIGASVSGALAWAFGAAGIAIETALSLKHVVSVAATSGYIKIFAKSDENLYKETGAGDEVRILDADIFTAAGDLVYGTGAETFTQLAKGTAFQELTMNTGATAPQWASGALALAAAAGDIFYATAANALAKLSLGTKGYALLSGGSAPQWEPLARKNKFLNGDMRVKTRATMPTADNSYAIDGLRLLLGAANAATISQDTATVPTGGSGYACKLVVGSGNNNKFGVFMPIANRNILDLRGGVVSVQAKMIATAGLSDIRWALLQRTSGTADGSATVPNSLVDPVTTWGSGGAGITTLADNWVAINTPANLSVGTSFGTTIFKLENQSVSASALNLALLIWNDDTTTTQTTDTMSITDVQLEKGAICTDIERLEDAQQVSNCEYWLQCFKADNYPIHCFGKVYDDTHADFGPLMRRSMRVPPTLSVTVGDWAVFYTDTPITATAMSFLYATTMSVWMRVTVASGLGASVIPVFLSGKPSTGGSQMLLSSEL